MKKLILPLILMSFLSHAANEMSDTAIKNQFLSTVKDIQVEKQLGASAEFNTCRQMVSKNTDVNQRSAMLAKATKCFQDEIGKKDEASLKKLSSSLGLQEYGLIKSNSVNDVTEYLQNKMTKALTGRDPNEKDPTKIKEQLKWTNQKIVDQKVFVDLYKSQLMKNALFEVSRYCFENLRKNNESASTFAAHWTTNSFAHTNEKKVNTSAIDVTKINDRGDPSFFKKTTSLDTSDKTAVYDHMLNGVSAGVELNPKQFEDYFVYCSAAMPLLCNDYKEKMPKGLAEASIADKKFAKLSELTNGAASCLAMDRLRSLRKAMENTDKVAKQFDEMEDKNTMALQLMKNPLHYERGNNSGEDSLDEISTVTSDDMLVGSEKNRDLVKLSEDCKQGSGNGCEDYLLESDGLEKAISTVETEMNFKREIEIKRVKSMKPQDLKEYLSENGMYELLNEFEKDNDVNAISLAVARVYEARKVATIESLKLKVGKRQLSEKDMKDAKDDKSVDLKRADNITESSQEKARLAQVVLFNNIITSQLNLEDKDGKSLGRNVTAWNREIKGISKASGKNENDNLFQGLQNTAAKEGKKIDNASLADGGIIDTILGKKADTKKP